MHVYLFFLIQAANSYVCQFNVLKNSASIQKQQLRDSIAAWSCLEPGFVSNHLVNLPFGMQTLVKFNFVLN